MKKIELPYSTYSDFFERLALLMHSGISIDSGLAILAEEEQDPQYVQILQDMSQLMEQGSSFADALDSVGCFSSHIIGMIRVSEQAGRTEQTLNSLAHYYESKERLSKNLQNALTYPSILMMIMLVIIVILISKVLPVFDEVYASFGGSLTGFSGWLVSLGNKLNSSLPFIGIIVGAIVIIASTIALIPQTSNLIKRFFMRAFGDKGPMRQINNALFVQSLSIALSSGLPIEQGIALAADLFSEYPAAAKRCKKCQEFIEDGVDLISALRQAGLLSASSCRILSVGMRAGSTDLVVEQIASRMADEAEDSLASSIARIEPTMVIFTSVMVGIIILSVLLPLVNIMNTIG